MRIPSLSPGAAIALLAALAAKNGPTTRQEPVKPAEPVVLAKAPAGRNESCPCGSGKKFKRCCKE